MQAACKGLLVFTLLSGWSWRSGLRAEPVGVVAKVDLFPAGSFTAAFQPLEGRGHKSGDRYTAKELKVDVKTVTTGFALRDKHLLEKLEANKYPFIRVSNVSAQDGKGTAKISIKGITKDLSYSYEILSEGLAKAKFNLSLADFKITGVSYQGVGVEDTLELVATVAYDDVTKAK